MNLDRSRFRELVASIGPARSAIAALVPLVPLAACGAHGADVQSAEVHIPAQPAPPAPSAGAPSPVASASASSPVAPKAALGSPADEGDTDDEERPASVTCGEVDTRSVRRPPAGACSDSAGTPGACIACSGFPFPGEHCAAYKKLMKPKVAEAAVACLQGLSAKARCDACAVYACGDRAMKGSCPDPTADVECRALRTRCPTMNLDDCGRYMSALLPAGRAKLRSCMTSCALFSCAEGL